MKGLVCLFCFVFVFSWVPCWHLTWCQFPVMYSSDHYALDHLIFENLTTLSCCFTFQGRQSIFITRPPAWELKHQRYFNSFIHPYKKYLSDALCQHCFTNRGFVCVQNSAQILRWSESCVQALRRTNTPFHFSLIILCEKSHLSQADYILYPVTCGLEVDYTE